MHKVGARQPATGRARRRLRQDSRTAPALVALALAVAAVAVGAGSTYSGFVVTMTNGAASPFNRLSTGTVLLQDNESSTAMFKVADANAGASGSACIGVRFTATVPGGADVYLYGSAAPGPRSLGPYLTLSVRDGTDSAPFADGDLSCSHFTGNGSGALATHATAGNVVAPTPVDAWPTSDATGFALADTGRGVGSRTWTSSPTIVWYRFTYHVAADAPAGASVGVALTWEADSL